MKAWMIKKPDGTLLDFTCAFNEDASWRNLTGQYSDSTVEQKEWKADFIRQGYHCVRVTIKEEK